jgi:beta-phosphoglucomutase-like phosphatase (HAD superfamily)
VLVADELARPKPDPLPYLTGLQRLGAEAGQALAFEDSLPGTAAASGAGIFTVGVATTPDPGGCWRRAPGWLSTISMMRRCGR